MFGVVITTHNRCALLRRCIDGLLRQDAPVDRIVVVDNASADDTSLLFKKDGAFFGDRRIDYVGLETNSGGAGGFHTGIAHAMERGCDWILVMDDDAYPESNAVTRLMAVDPEPVAIYAAAAFRDSGDRNELVWPVVTMEDKGRGKMLTRLDKWEAQVLPVLNAPFIGMLFHRHLIERIGLPDQSFFVSSDDAELCARAWRFAGGVRLVPSAVVRHPPIARRWVRLWRWRISVMELAPWRRYYDTRNRLVVAKRHFGTRLWTEVLPGTLARWLVTLAVQPGRLAQSRAFALGIWDGLTERLGMRWSPP